MSSSNTFRFKSAYGIDLSMEHALIVRAGRKGVQTLKEIELRPAALAGISEIAAGEHAAIACSMPVKSSFTQWIEAPFPSLSKARRVFDSLLDLQIPFGVEQCSRIFLKAGHKPEGNVEALAVGARWEQLRERVAGLREFGVDPECVDHEGLALWEGALREAPLDSSSWRAVIYLGSDRMVGAVGLGDRFEFTRQNDMNTGDAGRTDSDQACRFAHGLMRVMGRAEKNGRLEIVWVGPCAHDEGLRSTILDEISNGFDVSDRVVEEAKSFLARALALRALGISDGGNLRYGQMLHPHLERLCRRRERGLALTALLAGILLCVGNLVWASLVADRHEKMQSLLHSRTMAMTGSESVPKGMELEMATNALKKNEPVKNRILGMFRTSQGGKSILIADFVARNGIDIDRLDIEPSRLMFSGTALDWDACRKLSDYMAALGYKTDLQRSDAVADERIHFKISGEHNEL